MDYVALRYAKASIAEVGFQNCGEVKGQLTICIFLPDKDTLGNGDAHFHSRPPNDGLVKTEHNALGRRASIWHLNRLEQGRNVELLPYDIVKSFVTQVESVVKLPFQAQEICRKRVMIVKKNEIIPR